MGQSAEKMAKLNGIAARGAGRVRAALAPPRRAGHGRTAGSPPRSRRVYRAAGVRVAIDRDNGIRADTSLEQLAAAQAGVRPQVRQRHRRQRVAAHRRRERRAADERGRARTRSATSRSPTSAATPTPRSIRASSCCRGPCSRRRSRSRARAHARATWTSSRCTRRSPRRCCATSRRSQSQAWAERAGFARAGGRGRPRPHQRHGRLASPSAIRSAPPAARILTTLCNELRGAAGSSAC